MEYDNVFSQDELAQFGLQVEQPEQPEEKPQPKDEKPQLTADEIRLLMQQSTQDIKREVNSIKQDLTSKPVPEEKASPIQVKFGPNDEVFVDPNDLKPLVEKEAKKLLEQYHQQAIEPLVPAVQNVQYQNSIQTAVAVLKQVAPDLLDGKNDERTAQMALEFYQSPFNPYAADDWENRQNYALQQLRQIQFKDALPKSTGSQMQPMEAATRSIPATQLGRPVPAYSQVGRPAGMSAPGAQGQNPYGYAKGATIKLESRSLNDLGGLEGYQQYTSYVNALMDYNQRYNMGWRILQE